MIMYLLAIKMAMFFAPQLQAESKIKPFLKGTTKSPYGFYLYLPDAYDREASLPLLISLSAEEQYGNGTTDLPKLLSQGTPKLIDEGSGFPMIVAAPQSQFFWNPAHIDAFISYIIANYKVDKKRVYLTGFGHGGTATWAYIGSF